MMSLQVPFAELNFTGQIVEALQAGWKPSFHPTWEVPEPLQKLTIACLQRESKERPWFDEILIELLCIAEGFPSLHDLVIFKWKEYGHERAALPVAQNKKLLLQQNLRQLTATEEDFRQQIAFLQTSLEKVVNQKSEIVSELSNLLPNVLQVAPRQSKRGFSKGPRSEEL
jgi:uncharacterized protein YlxW (UPF0749 family)